MSEAIKSLKHFGDAKKALEREVERLTIELENQSLHRNPNQKIQLHLKIKEENNRLREDNLRLQEDLQKKMEIIQKHQKEQRNQILSEHTLKSMPDSKLKKDFDQLIQHIVTLP